jgi:DNA-binding NtrC family response regulator
MPRKAILCVDDEKIILDSLKLQMKKHFGNDYTYEFAQSAEEAWEIIEELSEEGEEILIVVSDWLMPYGKGDKFLGEVHQKHPEIVKVMLTGQADQEAIEEAQQKANLYRCIHKPWNEAELIEAIAAGLAKE